MSSSKPQFAQRRAGRVAALQYLFAWSINPPTNLANDLQAFFETQENPRETYSYGEEIINGVVVAENQKQAEDRCLGKINRGAEFARAALEMAELKRRFSK